MICASGYPKKAWNRVVRMVSKSVGEVNIHLLVLDG